MGQSFFSTFSLANDDGRRIRWVTQLVVTTVWRRRGIASQLIRTAVNQAEQGIPFFAVGVASSHPAAIRAMEKGVGSRCSAEMNQRLAAEVMAACTVPYLKQAPLSSDRCTVDTCFFIDHSGVLNVLATEVARGESEPDRAWSLGASLPEGSEFVAIVPIS